MIEIKEKYNKLKEYICNNDLEEFKKLDLNKEKEEDIIQLLMYAYEENSIKII